MLREREIKELEEFVKAVFVVELLVSLNILEFKLSINLRESLVKFKPSSCTKK